MKPIIYFAHWINGNKMDFNIPVHIYNVHADMPKDRDVINVLNISNEPEPTRMLNKKVIDLHKFFDLILTWDKEILNNCLNARFFPCGMTWINENDYLNNLKEKQFKITTFCGAKNLTYNHQQRHILWNRQREINNIPFIFYNSSHHPMYEIGNNPFLGSEPHEKFVMFQDSQFSIAIENSCYENYFTEKLMDCFITKTIPIYWGCQNINNFFNDKGIIQVRSVDDVISVCNQLNPNYYKENIDYVEENFNLCLSYCRDFTERIKEEIDKFLEERR